MYFLDSLSMAGLRRLFTGRALALESGMALLAAYPKYAVTCMTVLVGTMIAWAAFALFIQAPVDWVLDRATGRRAGK
jgi:hypothetical protein